MLTLPSTSEEDLISGRVIRNRSGPIEVFPFKKGTNSGVVEKTVPTNSEELGNLTVNLYLVLSTNKVE